MMDSLLFCLFAGSGNPDPAMLNRYRLGYSECINEVSRYLDSSESAVQLRTQLIGHLANHVPAVSQQQQAVACTPVPTPAPIVATAAMGPPSAPQQPPTAASQTIQVQIAPSSVTTALPTKVEIPSPTGNIATATRVVSGIPVGVPGAISTGQITVVLPPQALQGGQLPSHFIPVYAQSAPSLLSPASSTSSQCLPSPTSSAETPSTPTQTHHVSYQYQQPKQELPSPTSYEQQQTLPQTVSYMPAGVVPTRSPLVGSVAPVTTSTAVQAPTLVAMPTNVLTPPPEPTFTGVSQQQHQMPVSQSHIYYQSSPKSVLRTVNVNVQQQQCATADENVWRPW